jgi:hypothetical protein
MERDNKQDIQDQSDGLSSATGVEPGGREQALFPFSFFLLNWSATVPV